MKFNFSIAYYNCSRNNITFKSQKQFSKNTIYHIRALNVTQNPKEFLGNLFK